MSPVPPHVVVPLGGQRTYGGRQGRMSATRQRAYDELLPKYAVELPAPDDRDLLVEIGCGRGDATAAMAPADAPALVIACEPNGAMLANLLLLIEGGGIENVRVFQGDALELLTRLGRGRVRELRVWFPDPWPKARHASKRLVTTERLEVLVDSLLVGGRLRLATDAPDYAAEALAAIAGNPRLDGGIVRRPDERPVTKFEARGLREGRAPIDIEARRTR
jgi:tRNA (guanine-N7-)-methyltransferase